MYHPLILNPPKAQDLFSLAKIHATMVYLVISYKKIHNLEWYITIVWHLRILATFEIHYQPHLPSLQPSIKINNWIMPFITNKKTPPWPTTKKHYAFIQLFYKSNYDYYKLSPALHNMTYDLVELSRCVRALCATCHTIPCMHMLHT